MSTAKFNFKDFKPNEDLTMVSSYFPLFFSWLAFFGDVNVYQQD